MTIHGDHPFPTDEDVARRLRGRRGGQVSLWTAGAGADRVGLTVSSYVVVLADPARVVAFLDPDSDLGERLGHRGARAVLHLLSWRDREIADRFAGLLPAPGGLFASGEWRQTDAGPRLAGVATWAELTVEDLRSVGWSVEVTCRLDAAEIGADEDPLLHRRGRYHR